MENVLLSLAVLACPVGMGLMMFFMAKGTRRGATPAPTPADASVEQLREEYQRVGDEIERLEEGRPSQIPVGQS